jgi:16S rRNA (guanine527-N7)-methyltransferase
VRELDAAVSAHLADSLAGLEAPELRGALSIADVGSGAGFPGLVLAVALPAARVDLIESVRRKEMVIDRLATAAGIANVRIVGMRSEAWAASEGWGVYDAVTARAVAPLAVLIEYAAPLLRLGGSLVAWKGARDLAEEEGGAVAAEQLGMRAERVTQVVPFEGARSRHLHVFAKEKPTLERFPRRPGMARKRPLG